MLVTQVQWTANSTMNIMRRRMTMEPMLVELARSLIWWAGSTEGAWEEAALDCCFYQRVCVLGGGALASLGVENVCFNVPESMKNMPHIILSPFSLTSPSPPSSVSSLLYQTAPSPLLSPSPSSLSSLTSLLPSPAGRGVCHSQHSESSGLPLSSESRHCLRRGRGEERRGE